MFTVISLVLCLGCAPAREASAPDARGAENVGSQQDRAVSPAMIAAIIGLILLLLLANDVDGSTSTKT